MLCVINNMEVSGVLKPSLFSKVFFTNFWLTLPPLSVVFMLQGSIKEIFLLIYKEKEIFMNIKQA